MYKVGFLKYEPFTLSLKVCIMSVYSKKYNGIIQME